MSSNSRRLNKHFVVNVTVALLVELMVVVTASLVGWVVVSGLTGDDYLACGLGGGGNCVVGGVGSGLTGDGFLACGIGGGDRVDGRVGSGY